MYIKYDQTFMRSTEGRGLYAKWRNIGRLGRSEEWDDFGVFCAWAMDNGYQDGMMLKRKDARKDFGPDNCYWLERNERESNAYRADEAEEFCARWNKTVNRLRVHCGMEPFEVKQ